MPNVTVQKRIDVPAISEDWHLLTFSVGPRGDLTMEFTEQPYPWHLPPHAALPDMSMLRALRVSYRLIYWPLETGSATSNSLALRASRRITYASRFSDGCWFVVWRQPGDGVTPNAQVLTERGEVQNSFLIGHSGNVQVTSDDRIWVGYGDEQIYGGSELEGIGIACLDREGVAKFRFNYDATGSAAAPTVWTTCGLTVVSDNEVWCAFHADTRAWNDPRTRQIPCALARITDYRVSRIWP